jgi:FMN phosphatase YigB (HAD superfamily)
VPEFFLSGLRTLGLPSPTVATVGDDPEADVLGAMDAGLRDIRVGEPDAWPHARRPDRIVASIRQL